MSIKWNYYSIIYTNQLKQEVNEKILILGSSGLVGQNFIKKLDNFKVYSTYNKIKKMESDIYFDITDNMNIEKVLNSIRPDIIVNLCNIYKNLEFCENNKELVKRINGNSLETISKHANKIGAYLVSLSSDFVFDGKKGNYKEEDELNPINFYGQTKAIGENYVKNTAKKFCIVRTSMVFGKNKIRKTLPDHILEGIKDNQKYKLINDQFMTPTHLDNLSSMLKEIIENKIQGVFHLVGKTKTTRFEFGIKLCEMLNIDKNLLVPVRHTEFNFSKFMPFDSSLNSQKASRILSEKPLDLETALKSYLS